MYPSAILALALPGIAFAAGDLSSCKTGSVQCCNNVQVVNPTNRDRLAGVLGVSAGSITGLVGLNCSPLSVIGVGGNSCSSQPVCCSHNGLGGGSGSMGCSPININL